MARLGNRFSRRLYVWGILILGIGAMLLVDNRFTLNSGGHKRIITRQSDPLTYWGIESGILLVGLSLIAAGIYFSRRVSGADEASSARNYSFAMRTTALILALFAAGNLARAIWTICSGSNSRWPEALCLGLLAIFLLAVAVGIWRKRFLAWRLGFAAIALGAFNFIIRVCSKLPAVNRGQKTVIITSCLIGGVAVAVYWSVIWYRQRKWFDHSS